MQQTVLDKVRAEQALISLHRKANAVHRRTPRVLSDTEKKCKAAKKVFMAGWDKGLVALCEHHGLQPKAFYDYRKIRNHNMPKGLKVKSKSPRSRSKSSLIKDEFIIKKTNEAEESISCKVDHEETISDLRILLEGVAVRRADAQVKRIAADAVLSSVSKEYISIRNKIAAKLQLEQK